MKKKNITSRVAPLATALMVAATLPQCLRASPYASALNYYASSNAVTFVLNEGSVTYPTTGSTTLKVTNAVTVMVTYEDGTTNDVYNGISGVSTNMDKGQYFFFMTNSAVPGFNHTGYSIAVTKLGNGVANQISIDSSSFSGANPDSPTNFTFFNVPRGLAVNSNPKIGSLFGRVYVSAAGTPPAKGLYMLNADLSLAFPGAASMTIAQASNSAAGAGIFANSSTAGPWKLRVAPDNSVIVEDYSTADAALWLYSSDLTSSNLLLGPIGQTASAAAGIHGDFVGSARLTGSLAAGNLVLWTADSGFQVPSVANDPTITFGPGTSRGMYNNVFRYDIGAGPLPWTQPPNYAFNLGLDVIGELLVEEDIGPDGKVVAAFGRSNLSNPCLNVLDPTGASVLWTSWVDTGGNGDPWRGDIMGSTVQYPYSGVRVSPDDKYLVTSGYQNYLFFAKLTNGIPDDNTMTIITNSTTSSAGRGGVDWDAADNVYQVNGNTVELRAWSLGNSLTCVTSNDITGTNGTFVAIAPPVTATAVTTTQIASQNYGSPTPGVITISLTTNALTSPMVVAFTLSGSANYPVNYTFNLGANADGVIISSNRVTFPAGTWTHAGNWSVALQLTPTATPASGPALTATLTLLGGANYVASGSSARASVTIVNTGPQLLTLSVLSSGTTFSRAITNDFVKFVITRWGDVSVAPYTITNFNYFGTAAFPADYTARAQRFTGSLLSDGSPGITINSGEVFVTNGIGNPLMRANLNLPANNVTIVLSLTNATGTNVSSAEGFTYVVSATNTITLTELDNTFGDRVVLWSSPLTNITDSTNWTLTYASQALGPVTTLPVVIPNYTNNETSMNNVNGGTNDFDVEFGYPLPSAIPPSPAMLANGWGNVLMMTVNKSQGSPTAVNLYPQGKKFYGNYALRFSMYLSIWNQAYGNIYAGATPREYAIFGVNHVGTNCNWRPSAGSLGTTNADGVWFAIDEADNAATPADFDAFTSPNLFPNSGVVADYVSNAGSAMRNIFKNPPFTFTENPLGGEPVDQWADVSVEITKQTNCTIYIDGAAVLSSFTIGSTNTTTRNTIPMSAGTVMLGYLDPDASIGDAASQFVYYSNIRVVELSPYISNQPVSLIVTNGANVSFVSAATYATAPITNTWFQATTNPTPVTALQTDTAAATNLTSTLSLSSVQVGTNYLAIFSDMAGSVTGLIAQLEVIAGPTNRTVNAGSNFVQFVVIPSGPSAPTAFQWKTNGVSLVNGNHFAGVTNATLTITNAQLSDAVTYTCYVTNAAGSVVVAANLVVNAAQPVFSNITLSGTNALLNFSTSDPYDNTGSFTLQSSVKVQGPYTNTGTATITGSTGSFQFKVPLTTNTTMFYRLVHN